MAILSGRIPSDQEVVEPEVLISREIRDVSVSRALREFLVVAVSASSASELATVSLLRLSISRFVLIGSSTEFEFSTVIEGVTLLHEGVDVSPGAAIGVY